MSELALLRETLANCDKTNCERCDWAQLCPKAQRKFRQQSRCRIWGAIRKINRKSTGEFRRALVGSEIGKVGEIVFRHTWGGIDLKFDNGVIATYANDDVEEAKANLEPF